ncbi:lysylphosphatidylglycerol synthase domain-containing protein [Demequina lignilytica]|uniref:Lysylphosphatidylglycerol synthase domain-containing protein n=1 Tax=Demequina lignilytica TaxID=3051663 RepID=A0AB35MHU4_9MICO|nr:lysylphosphatidylglycerol synthase domain-containing protein [Demequina sp. SYSU T0a273]MDN4483387.1 lysylphosphatidylglycerol synthase domain-containing protein [Demequina sp. SYSU T0a273]
MRNALRWGFLALATALMAWAVAASWDEVVATVRTMSWPAVAASLAAAVVALGLSMLSWRAVMRAVGLDVRVAVAARVFFLSQMGKYVPGSVWPVLAQAELARDHGVSRARSMTGAIVAMIVGAVTAGIVGVAGLVLSRPDALAAYWWAVLAVLGMAAVLVPPLLHRVVGVAFRITRRDEAPARIGGRALAASVAFAVVQWLALGLHAWLLLDQVAPGTSVALACGAFAFAWIVGFVVVIAPAGAGAREAALVLALGGVVAPAQALSIALVSRLFMTLADVIGLGAGLAIGARRER